MRCFVIILGLWLTAGLAVAQQSAQYTQYIFNGLVINPAYAGSKEIWSLNAIYRDQWTGLEGAPKTQTFSADGSLKQNKLGIGMQVINDRLGAQGQLSALVSGAVRMQVSENGKLSFGLAGGATQYSLDGTMLRTTNPDPAIPNSKEVHIVPEAKAGLYFHTERFYSGISGVNLIPVKNQFLLTPERHYFLTAGYVFDLGEQVKIKPSFLVKDDFKSATSLDANLFVLFADRIWVGGSYRTSLDLRGKAPAERPLEMGNALAGIAEIYLTPKIKLGYAYDITLGGLRDYAGHEISLGYYVFKKDESQMLSPRYF
ncbi:MAG TPA: type IX secretion system membrane protein PorP/SprF [Adhaeribacter sp.]|nr:type IX secretion system membrane protein PorP/SprF [Adhaeribacter sp.]